MSGPRSVARDNTKLVFVVSLSACCCSPMRSLLSAAISPRLFLSLLHAMWPLENTHSGLDCNSFDHYHYDLGIYFQHKR